MNKAIKKSTVLALTAAMLITASSCGGSEPAPQTAPVQQTTAAENNGSETEKAETTEATDAADALDEAVGEAVSGERLKKSLSLSLDASGKMNITRAKHSSNAKMGDDGTWTIFVYICGSDLESEGNAASLDISEMLEASANENVRFVIEAGGANAWGFDNISPDKLTRIVVSGGEAQIVDTQPSRNMGDSKTLSDFLKWGVSSYAAANMGVIFWNHGGGSISGVCFDELNNGDSLSLKDIDAGLLTAFNEMTDKFEFIGFDACLMDTIETANVLATYANYMFASEEVEPGSGWDYTAIGNALAENSSMNGAELGKVTVDSFYDSCVKSGEGNIATLAVIDLSKIDDIVISFNDFAESLYNSCTDNAVLAAVARKVEKADNFGGNNKSEGYTNMVDFGSLVNACSEYADGADKLASAIDSAVVYKKNGSDHKKASGLSIYYPLSIQGSSELSIFKNISLNPYYLSFVDRISKASTGSSYADYSSSVWFEDDNSWSSDFEYEEDDASGIMYNENVSDDYFSYADNAGESQSGNSSVITFEQEAVIDEEGNYYCILDENGLNNTSDISAVLYWSISDDDYVIIGETYDVDVDWETGFVADNFDGYWLSLPDGQPLCLTIAGCDEESVLYTSPVFLNGEETNLRIRQYDDGTTLIEGTWAGIDESGMASREILQLRDGDKIIPIYDTVNGGYYKGDEYVFDSDPEIIYDLLFAGDYTYMFSIYDVFGNYLDTPFVEFYVEEDGSTGFYY